MIPADTLAVVASADWSQRGQAATVIVILTTLCVLNARRAARKIVEVEAEAERNDPIAHHPANRLSRQSRQVS